MFEGGFALSMRDVGRCVAVIEAVFETHDFSQMTNATASTGRRECGSP
jgi:hypothetical protein